MLRKFKSRQILKQKRLETCKIFAERSIYRALKRQTSWVVETGRLVISPNTKGGNIQVFLPARTMSQARKLQADMTATTMETYRASA